MYLVCWLNWYTTYKAILDTFSENGIVFLYILTEAYNVQCTLCNTQTSL